jgi:spore germination cell wall hydrolase CwlJ-like protein
LNGETKDPTKGALFFHNKDVGAFERIKTAEIGNHIFYR